MDLNQVWSDAIWRGARYRRRGVAASPWSASCQSCPRCGPSCPRKRWPGWTGPDWNTGCWPAPHGPPAPDDRHTYGQRALWRLLWEVPKCIVSSLDPWPDCNQLNFTKSSLITRGISFILMKIRSFNETCKLFEHISSWIMVYSIKHFLVNWNVCVLLHRQLYASDNPIARPPHWLFHIAMSS